MRIAIIGGKGMIGSEVTRIAMARGHEVTVLSRTAAESTQRERNEPTILYWDGRDAQELQKIIEGKDAVINLAGENIGKQKWTPSRKARLLKSRLEPAQALVTAFQNCQKRPALLLQASAIGYYGTGKDAKDESATAGSDYLARFAVQWENSTEKTESLGVRRVILRTGIVLQRNQGVLPRLMLPFRWMVGGPLGSGSQVYSWIHIQDEAEAILYLLEHATSNGIYNLTAPQPKTNSELGKTLAKVMHRPYWLPVPGFALKLILGEMSTLVLEGQRVIPARLLKQGFVFRFTDLQEALKDLLDKD